MKGLLGKKAGMTQLFLNDNSVVPVTIIDVEPNLVLQVKNKEKDGYNALKLAFDKRAKVHNVNRPDKGQFKKANSDVRRYITEIRDMNGYNLGDEISLDKIFQPGMLVDVTGTSKGKGFQGAIKRHNQARGPMGHGSKFHRAPGSIGDIRSTVKKGMPMPGQMGHSQVTVQNLEVILVDLENNILAVKGAVPGPNKSYLVIKENAKKLASKTDIGLINLKEEIIKNHLLEEGKKVGAKIDTEKMSIQEIKETIEKARVEKEKYDSERKGLLQEAKKMGVKDFKKLDNNKLKEEIQVAKDVKAKRAESIKKEAEASKKVEEPKEAKAEESSQATEAKVSNADEKVKSDDEKNEEEK